MARNLKPSGAMSLLPATRPLGLAAASLALAAAVGCADLALSDPEADHGRVAPAPQCTPPVTSMVALGGTVLTPEGAVDGYVVVKDQRIVSVLSRSQTVPAEATVVETDAIISPGFIDLHNHVAYNFLPRWDAGQHFQNRFEWAGVGEVGDENYRAPHPDYPTLVKGPYESVQAAGHTCQAVKYGEFRALVGGTTAIQGAPDNKCVRSWVRNVEATNFCENSVGQHGGSLAFLSTKVTKVIAGIENHSIEAYILHLAEGVDEASRLEFAEMRRMDLLRPEVVLIHGTALTAPEFEEMGDIGMKLVWSPQSNLLLYGRTTDIPTALANDILISLAPDWNVSGSANLLGELKVADRVDQETFGDVLTDEAMFRMVTANPADTIAMQDKIGRIAPGLYADLVVVRGDREHPYRALIDARPTDVLATLIGGEALYGEPRLLDALGKSGQYETLPASVACGEVRGIDVTFDSTDVPGGTESLQSIMDVLTEDADQPVVPLFDCGESSTAE